MEPSIYALQLNNDTMMVGEFIVRNEWICDVGWQVNHLDIAPRYAGVLVGISMTAGYLAGVLNPLIVAAIVKHQVCQFYYFASSSPWYYKMLMLLCHCVTVVLHILNLRENTCLCDCEVRYSRFVDVSKCKPMMHCTTSSHDSQYSLAH